MVTHVVARTLIFNDEHKVLLLRRSKTDAYRPDGLDFPGGRVDDGETFLAGGVRELQEETGLAVHPGDMQLVYASATASYNTDAQQDVNVIRLIFAAPLHGRPAIVLSDEHYAFAWYSLDEAIAISDHPSHNQILQYVRDNGIAKELWS